MVVIKRDGREVPFDKEKIQSAISKAFTEVNDPAMEGLSNLPYYIPQELTYKFEQLNRAISVEEIQDEVETELMRLGAYPVAKAYIQYRYRHALARDKYNELMDTIASKVAASDVQNQNANVDERSFGGRAGEVNRLVMKQYALDYCMSDLAKNNHLNNEIYTHDLDSYAVGEHNCTDGSAWITIKKDGEIRTLKVQDLASDLGIEDGQVARLERAGVQILSRDGWTKLNNLTRRRLDQNEKMYLIKTRTGFPLNLTAHHRLPVIRDSAEVLVEAQDVRVGDELLSAEDVMLSGADVRDSFVDWSKFNDENMDIRITNLSPLKSYLRFKYNVMFSAYATEHFGLFYDHTQQSIQLQDFFRLMDDYPLSYEVLSQLEISASGSKHRYPFLIPYSPQLAKVYAYVYSDGHVYENVDGSLFQLSFANVDEDIVDDFIDCFESTFGRKLNKCYPSEEYRENNSPCIRVHCGDKIIVRMFKDFAGGLMNGSGDLKIPDFVMNGDSATKYAYLSAAIDSDGSLNCHNIQITTSCKYYCEQLCLILQSLGYHACIVAGDKKGSTYHFSKSNRTGTRNFDSYRVQIYRQDEMADLYHHMNTVKRFDSYAYRGISHHFTEHKVVSVSEVLDADISVYDMETASHWYILNNFVSHNCLSVPFDHLLSHGFNTRQTDVRPANSLNTAMQLVAVIFQLQSLQQFGGVSATHLDWTMVPYVRKSFYKHFQDGVRYLYGEDFYAYLGDVAELPIESPWYNSHPKASEYALDMTEKECHQAVEALYHNLK